MKKYLVTGAMGFIGSHWCEHLLSQGHKVYGIDIYNSYPKLNKYKNFIFIQDSITNLKVMKEYIKKSDLGIIFNSPRNTPIGIRTKKFSLHLSI